MESAHAASAPEEPINLTDLSLRPPPLVFWRADPHQYGWGKIHIINPDDASKTLCGKRLAAFSGSRANVDKATCQGCANSLVTRQERKDKEEEWRLEREAKQRQWNEERRRHREFYDKHLASPRWRELRALVFKRSGGVCEGCGVRPATAVHHMTYQHLGDEFLWELRAICRQCHERFHGLLEA